MFYSHEVLTSRKYGVATVWLVATLGSKSSLKKVSRKAILDVDVQKACETIVMPAAPMALRLQSNLLYGLARVYSQQCGYVLSDAEAAKANMRILLKAIRAGTLDAEVDNKARPELLMLQDDPNFLPDFDLMPADLHRLDIELRTNEGSQRSTLSPHGSQQLSFGGSSSGHDIGGIIIPPSASSRASGLPSAGFGGWSARGDSSIGGRGNLGGLDDDLGLAINDDGTLRIVDEQERREDAQRAKSERTETGSVRAASGQQIAGGASGHNILNQPDDDDGFLPLPDDDYMPVLDAELDRARAEEKQQAEAREETSEETAEAPLQRQARPKIKIVPLDNTVELRNGVLAGWHTDYMSNMRDAIRSKNGSKATLLAKKNAEYWMLGQGNEGPLSIFSGARLLEALTGIKLKKTARKRSHDETIQVGDEEEEELRNVRHRSDSHEIARGFDYDDGYMPAMDDDNDAIEHGREAPTPIDERYGSGIMPWNQSTGSRRPTGLFSAGGYPTSASLGGSGLPLPRLPSRLTSASPLLGRGTADLRPLLGDDDIAMTDDFELFGPAADVDTQTAEQSQWLRAALDGESVHFLEFVQAGIEEMDASRAQAALGDEEDEALAGSVDFDVLLPPKEHTRIVAAQGLLHVLSLGTKGLLSVEQMEAFGAITLRAVAAL